MRRKKPLLNRPPRSKYKRRERDVDYMLWVRKLPCAAREIDERCDGHVQADHAGRRGMGQKADDRTCIPLCAKHHEQRASFHGPFRDWTQDRMRTWLLDCIARTQDAYTNLCGAEHGR
jgi:hypothetical protein